MLIKFRTVKYAFDVPQIRSSFAVKFFKFAGVWNYTISDRFNVLNGGKVKYEGIQAPTVEHADQVLNEYLQHRKN